MEETETVWLELARQGDEDAFARIVEAYQRPVFSLCFRMLGEADSAEDAAQETFLRAYKNLHRYDPRRSFATWLLSIAAHYCIDRLRRKRLSTVSVDDEAYAWRPPVDPALSPEASLIRRQQQARVRQLLETLPAKDRAVVILYYWHDCSYQEIAETLSLSVSAVKSRLFRARRALAEAWQTQAVRQGVSEQIHSEGIGYETPAV